MPIPRLIKIQIVDRNGNLNAISNVLFGLKIFSPNGGWSNSLPFKTNSMGESILNYEDILQKVSKDNNENVFKNHDTKFELFIWSKERTAETIKLLENSMFFYSNENFLKLQLYNEGISPNKLEESLRAIKNKADEDKKLLSFLNESVNGIINIYTHNIIGIWYNPEPKNYNFIIEK